MPKKGSPESRLLDAAKNLIEDVGWQNLSIIDVGRAAKCSATELYDLCPSKRALLLLLFKQANITLIENATPVDPSIPIRDRTFDAILNWFEGLDASKSILSSVVGDLGSPAISHLDLMPALGPSAQWIINSSELSSTSWRGLVLPHAIAFLLSETLPIWLSDDQGLSKTMAHIDRRLRLVEEWGERVKSAAARTGAESED